MSDDAVSVLSDWNWDPSIWIGFVMLVGAYYLASGRNRSRFRESAPIPRHQVIWFGIGVFVFALALVTPLDAISDHYLFSAHMVQHILLTLVAPPLVLIGTPGWMLRPFVRSPQLRAALRVLTNPIVAFSVFNINFMLWHVPMLYEATLENEGIHIAEHLLFIATAFLNWWPILGSLPELPRLPQPGQILYLFLDAVPSTVLGAIFIFASDAMYPTYANAAPIFGIDPLTDQIYSGLIMAMPGAMIYLVALSIVFFRWLDQDEKNARATGVRLR